VQLPQVFEPTVEEIPKSPFKDSKNKTQWKDISYTLIKDGVHVFLQETGLEVFGKSCKKLRDEHPASSVTLMLEPPESRKDIQESNFPVLSPV
jgi:hypothetical protein